MGRPHLSRRRRRTWIAGARTFRPILECLEERTVLNGRPSLPPTFMLTDPTGLLSAPSEDEPLAIALDFLADHAGDFGLTAADLADPVVTSRYTDADTGFTHIYLRQRVNGLEVAYADIAVSLTVRGEVIAAGGGFVPGLSVELAA